MADSIYACKVCGKIFYRISNYNSHISRHLLGFDCGLCLTPHLSAADLSTHVTRCHENHPVGGGGGDDFHEEFRPSWEVHKTSEKHSKKFQKGLTRFEATLKDPESIEPTYENFNTIFETLINAVIPQSAPTDYVGLTIESQSLDFPIPLNYVQVSDLTSAMLFNTIENKLNSNENFQIDNKLKIQVDHVRMPVGSGCRYAGEYPSLDAAIKSKKSIISIREDNDDLCFPSAVVLAIERYKALKTSEPNCYNLLRRQNQRGAASPSVIRLKELARALLQSAGLSPKPCGISEIQQIQSVLPMYQISVYSARAERELVFKGAEADRKINFIIDEIKCHYHVITSLTGWFSFPFHCSKCDTFYHKKFTHRCSATCTECCRAHESDFSGGCRYCKECGRTFSSELCYTNHLTLLEGEKSTVCHTLRRCEKCDAVGRRSQHKCGIFCSKCFTRYQPDSKIKHECFISVKKFRELKHRKFIFYDIESMLVPVVEENSEINSQHVPNLLIAWRCCTPCADASEFSGRTGCQYCGEFVFKGVDCIARFINFVFDGSNKGASCIAHNAQAYDSLFIFRELRRQGKTCELRNRGNKLLELSVQHADIRFIDSINFLITGLSKLPAMFGLKELKKGFFPHRFNTPENQTYRGKYPDRSFYDMEDMRGGRSETTGKLVGQAAEFDNFYNSAKDGYFDLQKELYQYCLSDVIILRDACLQFRKDFLVTTGLDPLVRHMTLSQLAMDYYRNKIMKPETIARITSNSHYGNRSQSVRGLQWLHYHQSLLGRRLIMKSNLGEKKIGPFYCDGFDAYTNTVYEFLGDFWHGNLSIYSPTVINPKVGKSMGELNCATVERLNYIKSQGYTVVSIWEADYMKNEEMQKFAKNCNIVTPLAPRECLYGGRTNALKLKHEVQPGEKIYYDDFISLYPSILKYSRFPVGHPNIILDNFKSLDNYFGLIKCKILPPQDLYIPVLPQRFANKKLVFPLCKSCAEQNQQVICDHTEDQRALLGSWCTPEVAEAIAQGYKILEIYEIWDFPDSSQYNVTTREHGLFSAYVDIFFKLKLQYSGWPPGCEDEAGKDKFIEQIYKTEGLKLSKSEICKNPGLRTLAKLLLNSFWGKFGQKDLMSTKKVITTRMEMLKLLADPAIIVDSMLELDEESLLISYKSSEEFVEGGQSTNVVIAAFVTCWARLKLYGVISKLNSRCLYFDTDSVIHLAKADDSGYVLPRGEALGELKSELSPGNHIIAFCSSGPKSYSYVLKDCDGPCKSKVVLKGISLTYGNSQVVSYDNILNKIEKFVKNGDNSASTFYQTQNFFYRAPNFQIFMRNLTKKFRCTYDKRLICQDYTTVPFGYKISGNMLANSVKRSTPQLDQNMLPLKKRCIRPI